MTDRITTSRRIAAPASAIFAVVSDPAGHVRIDGSGMLVASDGPGRLTSVGDAFEMDMVTRWEPDTLIEWSVAGVGRSPIGHVYGYELTAVSADETEVSAYCDWSAISPKWRERVSWPVVPVHMLARSLENLDRIVTGQSTVDAR
jgi:hypothetical protein